MILTEEEKIEMLNSIKEDEQDEYKATIWGVIVPETKKVLKKYGRAASAFAALENKYCYIGITDKYIAFATINTFNTSQMMDALTIDFDTIKKVKVKNQLIRKLIYIYTKDDKLMFSLNSITLGSKLNKKNQVDGIKYIINKLKSL